MTMTNTLIQEPPMSQREIDARGVVADWVAQFTDAASARNGGVIADLFKPEGTIRDLLALTWDLRNAVGREAVTALVTDGGSTPPTTLAVDESARTFQAVEAGADTIWTFLTFTTKDGSGDGYVKLVHDEDGQWRASALILSLSNLTGIPEQIGDNRPLGRQHGAIPGRVNFVDAQDREFENGDPAVVILGAGHNGLSLAARLRNLGVPALVIETNDRVGDTWRKRYSSLALHTPIAADQLPYLPYPASWTRFTPKDKLGDFLESYATLLDLTVWTGSHVENVTLDAATRRWTFDVVRSDGSRRTMSPHHLVLATGNNAQPIMPDFPTRADYQGEVIHAVEYKGWDRWVGKKAVVVGCGVSGHDIAQDLAEHGVDVTMVQRSGVVVLNTSTFHKVMHAVHTSGNYSVPQGDLINAATPFGVLPSYGAGQLAQAKEMDRELLEGLTAAGFELSDGPDGQGVLGLIFGKNSNGYYYNAGASELIADGTIKIAHGSVTGYTTTGVTLDDGSTIEADLVVFASGYTGPDASARQILGDEIASKVEGFAKVGDDGEYGRLWRRSGIDGLWFMIALSIEHGRFYSKHLALQLAAIEKGIIPERVS